MDAAIMIDEGSFAGTTHVTLICWPNIPESGFAETIAEYRFAADNPTGLTPERAARLLRDRWNDDFVIDDEIIDYR